jgi:isoquinoline 1-oxidoreductase subunit beta
MPTCFASKHFVNLAMSIDHARRQFVISSLSLTGLTLAVGCSHMGTKAIPVASAAVELLAWLKISLDGKITLFHTTTDVGQGTPTALAQIVADQLDVAWESMRLEHAPLSAPFIGDDGYYATSSSSGISTQFEDLAKLGASARLLLIRAAAERWNVPTSQCSTQRGFVLHPSTQRSLGFGAVARSAALLPAPLPASVVLRPLAETSLVGTSPKRLDAWSKVTGKLVYGVDVQLKDLRIATIRQCPLVGGRLISVDPEPAKAITGVHSVITLPNAVAVVARNYWLAKRGLDALNPQWQSAGEKLNSLTVSNRLRSALRAEAGIVAPQRGIDSQEHVRHVTALLKSAAKRIDVVYEAPLAAHATMEPQNATAHVTANGAELWLPTQNQGLVRKLVAAEIGVPLTQVTVHTTGVGGSFGRRLEPDCALQAVRISKAIGGPVKLIWSREEDMRQDFYRPPSAARLRAGLDANGTVTALQFDIASSSILGSSLNSEPLATGGVDYTALMGLRPSYSLPRAHTTWTQVESGLRSGWWRSVGASQNTFFIESFIDELAHSAGVTPLAFRQQLLQAAPREKRVLEALVALAKLDTPAPPGRHRGIALVVMSGTVVAQSVELSVEQNSKIRLHQICCVMDCGTAINRSSVTAQIESSIAWGLSACVLGEITLRDGQVEQANFHDYPVLRASQLPPLAIELLNSEAAPGGAGEEAVPPVAPAIANALFAATGRRIRELPFRRAGFELA